MESVKWWPEGTKIHLVWDFVVPPGQDPKKIVNQIKEAMQAALKDAVG